MANTDGIINKFVLLFADFVPLIRTRNQMAACLPAGRRLITFTNYTTEPLARIKKNDNNLKLRQYDI